MHLSKRNLLNIIQTGGSAETIANIIMSREKTIEELTSQLGMLRKRKRETEARHAEELAKIDERIKDTQMKCEHEWNTNHDPSGGRDHDTRCTICDMEHP